MIRALLVVWLLAWFAPFAVSHEVRPAYLELRQTGPETFDVLWKVPGRGDDMRLGLYVELPSDCTNITEPRAAMLNAAFSERWSVRRVGGMTGGTIHIAGLNTTMTDVLVRLERLDGTTLITRLTPSAPSFVVGAAPDAWAVARTYGVLGVEHILLGIDHLLFVLGLLLIVGRRLGLMLKTITAFTVAHSITLAVATLGWVAVPIPPVEAVIALSIVFLAVEIVHARRGRPGLAQRRTWVVAFLFGLLHGLGFASALSEVGLPPNAIPAALFFFNVGVEAGQLLFVAAVLPLLALARRMPAREGVRWTWQMPVYAIGAVAAYWVIERIAGFWA
jgi:hydrogenase/urease accessory protein HupE